MTASKDVATRRSVRSTVAARDQLSGFNTWVEAMMIEASLPEDSEFDPAVILDKIMQAPDFDAAVAAQDSSIRSGKSLVGEIHTIHDFKVRISDEKYRNNDHSLGVWFAVDASTEDGDSFTYGVGASNVLAILWQARQFGKIPGKFVIGSRETANGDLLSIRPVKVALQGKAE